MLATLQIVYILTIMILINQNRYIFQSNSRCFMRRRLTRWLIGSASVSGAVFVLAGTWRDPWLWGYAVVWSGLTLYGMFSMDEDLARERFHPPTASADAFALTLVR